MKKRAIFGDFLYFTNDVCNQVNDILDKCDELTIILTQCFVPRDIKIPFLAEEIAKYIKESVNSPFKIKFQFEPKEYYDYSTYSFLPSVTDSISLPIHDDLISLISSIELRKNEVTPSYFAFVKQFKNTKDYINLLDQNDNIKNVRRPPNCYVSTDIVTLVGSRRILLIERKGVIGKGTLALPGGHLNPGETLIQCAYREFIEETGAEMTFNFFASCIRDRQIFDAPDRSLRGPHISQVYLLNLDNKNFNFKAGDDAASIVWVNTTEFIKNSMELKQQMFADHYEIVKYFIDKW